ncbi:MAG: type II toxin-antitoxin system RelE/ParE family toxin [Methylomonas sp.]
MILQWLPLAIADRDAQLDYIAIENITAAIEQGDRIADHVKKLIDHPKLGRPGRKKGTRELVIDGTPFIAVYQITGNVIQILRVLHGARKWP